VIEHVPDPRSFLRSVRALLEPRGFMVLVTPNTAGLQPRLFGANWRSAIADHVHLFSRRNLERMLREEGFEILQVQTWGGLGIGTAPAWIKRPIDRLAKRLGFGDVVLVLSRRLD
jgi:cyclopropane fatty-acyl-phospholipid synthase-like methyltransferase